MLDDLLDPILGPGTKGWPHAAPPLRRSQVAAQGWRLLHGDLPLPLAVLRRAPLEHNLGWMQRFADGAGVGLAPHGKTTMSPQLFARQLAAGAWGLTVANVAQARLAVDAGARRVVIANQVLQRTDLAALAVLLAAHPGLRAPFLLDSPAQLDAIAASGVRGRLEVVLELGLAGGRTGCRTPDEALTLARAAHASDAVRLCGVECFEGIGLDGDESHDRPRVEGLMDRVVATAQAIAAEGLFDDDEVLVTAGGSAVFDLVAARLRPALPGRYTAHGLLRSGCYLAHDDGFYRRLVGRVDRRIGCAEGEGLRAAIEVWAVVQSVPEPGLAVLGAGKRDLSHDLGLPVPVRWCAASVREAAGIVRAPASWVVTGLNDQHAMMSFDAAGAAPAPVVGDRVALGISHPCTTFDKWRWMPVVDDEGVVVDAITTCF